MAEYPINKGIGRPVEFKGLKAQYLFIFCGGLLALFVLFVILYMVGTDQWICCLLYTSPSPRDKRQSRMPSSA